MGEAIGFDYRGRLYLSEDIPDLIKEESQTPTKAGRLLEKLLSYAEYLRELTRTGKVTNAELYHIHSGEMQVLFNGIQTLHDSLDDSIRIKSNFDLEKVPVSDTLYIIGGTMAKRYQYTVSKDYFGDVEHDLKFVQQPLDEFLSELNSGAVYHVTYLPRALVKRPTDLKRVLLRKYNGIKRQIAQQGLEHYPVMHDLVN
ncbi:hypothetical protein GOV11_05260 [Candidatus Woesearchaeota archaeon]|nr:hypothetical protein [Candidatus Woesearchaeota archaeon]